ncbi:protein phosphatase 2C 70 isoform X2 [Physcomitrium patens]|uniref:protein-serine/threonine phosphatase n=2 Tax=Physcomitrium patens TaxID=3218 RepID=A0A7I4FA23_PHYPA|nr:protein phosphatase 2C 70-like isoform X2 [Physcomitrium patens]|eukprot:XP_024356719.1 protein phosphatase 2C 70-like isoform X2 [Physcomitrella patens]
MWGLGVRTTKRAEGEVVGDGKMEVTKVLICGGLVVVVAYGIYTCSCRLRHRLARSYHEPESENNSITVQRPKDLLQPLLEDSDAVVGLGQTWRGSRGSNSIPDVERGLDTAATVASDSNNDSNGSGRKVTNGGEVSKARAASSNLNPQNCKIQLEVVAGPVSGLRAEKQVVGSNAVLTIGRMPQNDLVLNDPEVSGKHVVISWNGKLSNWELIDMGSLNGTLVNSRPAGAAQKANSTTRQRGLPTSLSNGDTITLGSSSNVLVRILASHLPTASAPFEVGVASDPMSHRRGGRPLPMEDVCLCEWPLRAPHEVPFGIFCVFDGHGGSAAAEAASRFMPQKISELLAVEETRMGVISNNEASNVLLTAFRKTEEALDFPYEGCTATVLLLWPDATSGFLAQCANVGDSHCIVSNGDEQLLMTEDHRLTSKDERLRLLESGKQLKEGENRLADPYISNVFRLSGDGLGLVVMASDGLWDVLSPRRALQLAAEARDRVAEGGVKGSQASAQGIAKMLVDQAREKRTKDNTSVIILDFATKCKSSFHTL